jgi:phage regulator Rha-like protein
MTQQNPFAQFAQPVDEFEIMRQRLRSRGAARGEQAQRQVARQSAALGNLPSGAALKLQQQTARATEQQTGQELQDINILQAQTQRAEREAEAERGLRRFGIETQARTGLEQARIGAQAQVKSSQIGAGAQVTAARIGAQSALDVTKLDTQSKESIAALGANNDFNIARMQGDQRLNEIIQQGATDQQILEFKNELDTEFQEMQNKFEEKRIGLLEAGMDSRLADQIAANKDLFDLEMIFKEKGLSIQERLNDANIEATQADTVMSQIATMTNMLDPLFNMGFELDDVHGLMSNLDTPFSEEIAELARVRHNELRNPSQQFIADDGGGQDFGFPTTGAPAQSSEFQPNITTPRRGR